jgi:hypothetical protein
VSKHDQRRAALRVRIALEADEGREKAPVTLSKPIRDPLLMALIQDRIAAILDLVVHGVG